MLKKPFTAAPNGTILCMDHPYDKDIKISPMGHKWSYP